MSVHLKINRSLVDKIKSIVQAKEPDRMIKSDAKAINEALIAFVKKNKKFLDQKSDQEDSSSKLNSQKLSQEGQ